MVKSSKLINLVVTLISGLVFFLCIGLGFLLLSERNRRLTLQRNLEETRLELRLLEGKFQQSKEENERLVRELSEYEKQNADLSSQIDEINRVKFALEKRLQEKRNLLDEMTQTLESEKKEKLSLARELEELNKEHEDLKERLAQLQKEKEKLQARLEEVTKEPIDLEKVVVVPQPIKELPPQQQAGVVALPQKVKEGRVLVTDMEFGFIIIDLGQNDGVEVGETFLIYRGDRLIGRAQVDRVHDNMSEATILTPAEVEIKEGDVVRSQ
jgi:septal ring factor EnvC (AmiA/AmiB activator)